MNQTVIQLSSGMIESAKSAGVTTFTKMLPAPLTEIPIWLTLAVLHKKKAFSLDKNGGIPDLLSQSLLGTDNFREQMLISAKTDNTPVHCQH